MYLKCNIYYTVFSFLLHSPELSTKICFSYFSKFESHLEGDKLPGDLRITPRWFWLKQTQDHVLRNTALTLSPCNSPNGSHFLPLRFLIQCSSAWNILDPDFLPCQLSFIKCPTSVWFEFPSLDSQSLLCVPLLWHAPSCAMIASYLSDSPTDCTFLKG